MVAGPGPLCAFNTDPTAEWQTSTGCTVMRQGDLGDMGKAQWDEVGCLQGPGREVGSEEGEGAGLLGNLLTYHGETGLGKGYTGTLILHASLK